MAKGRDSGMPAIEPWESYFDAAGIVDSLRSHDLTVDAIEFGCGYGPFTIPLAHFFAPLHSRYDFHSTCPSIRI
jgi:hypothetical protein